MREYGKAEVLQAKAELFDRAESMIRAAILSLPDGTYRFHDFLDDDGVDLERRVRIEAAVTIQGSELLVEFDGTSPQVRGPMNCVPSSTLAVVYYVVTAMADPERAQQRGVLPADHGAAPEGQRAELRSIRPPSTRGRSR